MDQLGIVIEPVSADQAGKVRIINQNTAVSAVAEGADHEFLKNELVRICRIKDNVAYCQQSMLDL
ncbi:hypothetical protein AWM75_05310 [Aerococcus urinaehominis]|uniref:Uncharacterized protein n=2 Tax=Aerococcus urinaehominis TaxID=128944 RepID=A0A0X8FLJ2_9LACT|nr:hypothetical protein [Aerococcus urinaehominis]AMB99447.1 hypothetical protein AWM75_05310 [Aerococcus urinaehominis]SDM28680.1 hypothetical protein SAMN04487985_11117 [Aerococcus urinaehominis]